LFPGWRVVGVMLLGMSTNPGPFVFASFGLFMLAFQREFGWGRGDLSLALTGLTVSCAVALPIVGRMIDRIGARRIQLVSMAIQAALLAAIPLFVSEIWHLTVLLIALGALTASTNGVAYMHVISAWFHRQRGLAIGLVMAGTGLGYTYVPVLVRYVIDTYSWRAAYFALAGIILFIALPLVYFWMRESPRELGLRPDGDPPDAPAQAETSRDVGLDLVEILRRREFWILVSVLSVLSFALHGLLAHLVPMLVDRGMSSATAASVAAAVGVTVMLARVLVGHLMDRFFAPRVAMTFFVLSALGLVAFASGAVDTLAFLAAILVGLSIGAEVDMVAYLAGRYFGLKSFGATFGLLFGAVLIGITLGPVAFGYTYEGMGSYVDVLWVGVGCNVFAILLMAGLGPFPDWSSTARGNAAAAPAETSPVAG
jgi:predicted MFS family arabinose efflux permease